MSVHVSTWAWQQRVGDDGAKLVLLKLADQANDDGVCFPARKRLAEECECTIDTVKRRLRRLRDLGLIQVFPWFAASGRQTSSAYLLLIPGASESSLTSLEREGGAQDPLPSQITPPRGASETPSGGALAPPLEPSEEPSEEPKAASEKIARPPDVVWDALDELFGQISPLRRTQARGRRNRAVADLKSFGATPDTIRACHRAWSKLYDGATVTDIALATHYPQLLAATGGADAVARRQPPCAECSMGGGLHVADCSRAAAA